ncbi:MAG: hypothetical protein JW891_12895 [Candidatus Lokiarchaeota archaeon]|nr:hypothetical protein [Candidatus Lokiarchaeota archaeon]
MARKKKSEDIKPSSSTSSRTMGWDAEDQDEALEAEGMKSIDMDEGYVELIDKDTSTPFIETYDEDTGELEGKILLKDGNRRGKLALVKIIEDVKVKQDHEANIESIGFAGKLNVENPSKVDRIWDIDITLKNIGETNLKSDQIQIRELGTDDDNNVDSRDFKIAGEAKNLLLVKEYVNTLPDADNILNIKDIESHLLTLESKKSATETIESSSSTDMDEDKDEDEDEDLYDGGVAGEYSLESYGISIDKENTVTFVIAMRSQFEKPIANVKVVKTILSEYSNVTIKDTSVGRAEVSGDELIWNIDKIDPKTTELLTFTATIQVSSIQAVKTGPIEVSFQASSSFSGGLDIDKFDAYTRNKFYVDIIERDEEPEVWDCKLVFENSSEFIVELFNADVYSPDDNSNKLVDIDPGDVPRLPAGAQFHSKPWMIESEDYPQFRKKLEFRVMPNFMTIVNGTVAITDVELAIASITSDVIYSLKEIEPGMKREGLENLIQVPTFKEKDVYSSVKILNNGSAPLDEVTVQQQFFTEEYQPPSSDEIKLFLDDGEVELDSSAVSFEGGILSIVLKDLKNSSTGMFEPESTLEAIYPIHCVKPSKDARFESEIICLANTYPLSNELEYRPEVPVIEALHIRRRLRVGKEIEAIGSLGQYKIILTIENIGNMALNDLVLLDKVPDNFEYGNYSMQPEITDEVGEDTLKWSIDTLEEEERIEITYEITGSGDYSPSEAQLSY